MAGLHFEFQRPLVAPLRRGPFREVAFQGEKMFVDGDLEAAETENRWRRKDGENYSGIDFLTRLDVYFIDQSRTGIRSSSGATSRKWRSSSRRRS